jgi:hypothetical protein
MLLPLTYLELVLTETLIPRDRLILLQYAHFHLLLYGLCRAPLAAVDRVTGKRALHWLSMETLEKLESWLAAAAAPFLLPAHSESLVQSLGDLLQEHLHSAIRRDAHGDDRPAPILRSMQRQLLAQILRARHSVAPELGASRIRSRHIGAIAGPANSADIPCAGEVFTWVVDNVRLLRFDIPARVVAQLQRLGVWSAEPQLRFHDSLIAWRPRRPTGQWVTTNQQRLTRMAGLSAMKRHQIAAQQLKAAARGEAARVAPPALDEVEEEGHEAEEEGHEIEEECDEQFVVVEEEL